MSESMITTVCDIKLNNNILDVVDQVHAKISEFTSGLSYTMIRRKVISVVAFGGSIDFDIPVGHCKLERKSESILVEVYHKMDKLPSTLYKVGVVKSDDTLVLMMVYDNLSEVMDMNILPHANIVKVYGNDKKLSITELGELWYEYMIENSGFVKIFANKELADEYYEGMKENLIMVKTSEYVKREIMESNFLKSIKDRERMS